MLSLSTIPTLLIPKAEMSLYNGLPAAVLMLEIILAADFSPILSAEANLASSSDRISSGCFIVPFSNSLSMSCGPKFSISSCVIK